MKAIRKATTVKTQSGTKSGSEWTVYHEGHQAKAYSLAIAMIKAVHQAEKGAK